MNDMDLLRGLGRELEHDPPATLARQRNRLTAARKHRTKSPHRRWWLLAVVVTTAVVFAVPAVLLSGLGGESGDARPQRALSTKASDPVRLVSPEMWPGRAPRPGQYVFVESKQVSDVCEATADEAHRQRTVCGPGTPEVRRVWKSADDSRPSVISVSSWGRVMRDPGCVDGRRVYKDRTERCRPQPADLSGLPTSVSGLSRYLDQRSRGGRPAAELRFKAGVEAFQESFIPFGTRQALVDAIARGPGVVRDADTTDWLGRKAFSLSFVSSVDATKAEVFFDPGTYQRIGLRYTMTESRDGRRKGSVITASAVTRIAFTDRSEVLP